MSEYQYYEFLALDRPLTQAQVNELRGYSSRARITPNGFINEYHWGSFKGDEDAWMERCFDAFLYTACWGTNTIMLRLPGSLLDPKTAGDYCHSEQASVRTKGGNTILTFSSRVEEVYEVVSGEGLLATMVTVRADLSRGDLRLLYLGWLLSVQSGVLSEDDKEPSVPAGLNQLSASLVCLREFLRIDGDLLAAGAEQSAALDMEPLREGEVAQWIATLPVEDKDRLLTRLVIDDDRAIAIEMQRRYFASRGTAASPAQESLRTVGQLMVTAKNIGEKRRLEAVKRADQERVQQEREAHAYRQRFLDMLGRMEPQSWKEIETLLTKPSASNYESAVKRLVDLRDLALRDGKATGFRKQIEKLRLANASRRRFLERLDAAEL